MKFAVHYGAFGPDAQYEEVFRYLASCGMDGVEVVMKRGTALPPELPDSEAKKLRILAEKYGLCISGLTNACLWDTPLTASDPAVREAGCESIRRQIHLAKLLGAENLLIIPGYAGTSYVPASETVRYDIALKRSHDGLASVISQAEDEGVCLCIENVWNRLLLSPLELAGFVDSFRSPAIGLYFDVGNAMLYGDPELWLSLLGNRVKAVHIKDALRGRADLSAFVPIGSGDVPFGSIRNVLKQMDYQGFCTLETHRLYDRDELRKEMDQMRVCMK